MKLADATDTTAKSNYSAAKPSSGGKVVSRSKLKQVGNGANNKSSNEGLRINKESE